MTKRKRSVTTDPLCNVCRQRHAEPDPCARCWKRHCPNSPGALNCEALHWGRHAPLETTRAALAPAGVSAAAALVPALRPAAAALDAGAQLMAPGHVRYPARGVGRILAGAGHDRESAGVWRMTLAADMDGAVAIYAWPFVVELDRARGPDGRAALALVYQAQPKPANLKRLDPIFPRITIGPVNPARERGELLLATDVRPGLRAPALPLFPEVADDDAIVPLLELATVATGDRAVSNGRGAAHELRLMFEALTALPPGGYAGGVAVAYTVEELLQAFYLYGTLKMHRSGDRPGDWAQIRAACQWIDRAALPWRVPSGNVQSWFLMRLRTLPGERPALSDPVVFEVALPPGSEHGPAVDRPALRKAGRVSSPAFRIGLAVPTLTWIPGSTRYKPQARRGKPPWLWIGNASRYPVLSSRDRRRIAFGPDATPSNRSGPKVDSAWRKAAAAAGVVILDTEAYEQSGKHGWRVVPQAAAEAIRAAREAAREKGRKG